MEDIVEGKLFLGGLDANTSNEAVTEYCSGWCEPIIASMMTWPKWSTVEYMLATGQVTI